ncbi:response regulator transcription factor [Actinoplanes sp. NPDC051411]|uniref:response regulator transcription factor n=1 Tax=Actinoplanes sp. NPDC051411 TaxID=3155522 RepID=UPI0034161D7E
MTVTAESISVAVLAEIRLYREGLREVLDRRPGITVVEVAGGDPAGVGRAVRCHPDVAVVDMTMPLGAPIARAFAEGAPDTRVVGLGVPDTEARVLACAEAGLAGCVSREGGVDELVSAIRRAARGEPLYPPRIVALLLQRLAQRGHRRPEPAERLTARELEVVELIDRGLTNKEIAERLFIEVATVKNHVHHILEKLRLRRRIDAANWLRGHGREPAGVHPPATGWTR